MIKHVTLGEEIIITTANKIGLLAEISMILAGQGINIEAVLAYGHGRSANVSLVTNASLIILRELKKKWYKSVAEREVVIVELENKPGALKVVSTELGNNGIDIKYLYVTSSSCGDSSRMILHTSDNEAAIAVLSKFV